MSALIEGGPVLPYLVNDADEHSTPPTSAYLQYIDPDKRDVAITTLNQANGAHEMIWGGKRDTSPVKSYGNQQVTGSVDVLKDFGVDDRGRTAEMGDAPIPGSLLNKLNPLKGLDEEGRREFARRYRELQEHLDNPADRLAVMDAQGIEASLTSRRCRESKFTSRTTTTRCTPT